MCLFGIAVPASGGLFSVLHAQTRRLKKLAKTDSQKPRTRRALLSTLSWKKRRLKSRRFDSFVETRGDDRFAETIDSPWVLPDEQRTRPARRAGEHRRLDRPRVVA